MKDAVYRAHSLKFGVVLSNPSFEFWFVLHFVYTTRPMSRDEACRELRKAGRIPGYSKGLDVYRLLAPFEARAITHAQQLRDYHGIRATTVASVPCTDADKLVEFLNALAR